MKRVVDNINSSAAMKKKKKVHAIDIRTRQKKPLYGTPDSRAPYYDPHNLHVHVWTFGTLQTTLESHSNPYYARQNKEYRGNYCKVCHQTNNRFHQNLVDKYAGYSEQTLNLQQLKNEMFVVDEKEERSKEIERRWRRVLGKLLHRKVLGIRYPSDPVSEDLILENVCCDFYWFGADQRSESKIKKGIIICQLPDKKVLISENMTGIKYQVDSHYVFSIYDKYTTKSNLYAIGEIPKSVLSDSVELWKEKWRNYKKWEAFQERLKFALPEQCQYYQTFYDDEIPEPVYNGPDTYDMYISKQVQHNMQMLREYKKSYAARSSTFDTLGSMKYKIYTFFIPPEGIYENYVVVEKDDDNVIRTYPTLQLYSRKLMETESKRLLIENKPETESELVLYGPQPTRHEVLYHKNSVDEIRRTQKSRYALQKNLWDVCLPSETTVIASSMEPLKPMIIDDDDDKSMDDVDLFENDSNGYGSDCCD